MKTLGIDPGTATTGYGVICENGNGLETLEYGCIKTSPKSSSHERLALIYKELKALIKKHKPDCVAVEKIFFGINTKTAIAVGQARGVILLSAAEAKVKIAEYTPLQVKLAITGYGRAEKGQIQKMVKTLLKLKQIPKPDDAADALAIALCQLNSYKYDSALTRKA